MTWIKGKAELEDLGMLLSILVENASYIGVLSKFKNESCFHNLSFLAAKLKPGAGREAWPWQE